jgi:hypothetical protein
MDKSIKTSPAILYELIGMMGRPKTIIASGITIPDAISVLDSLMPTSTKKAVLKVKFQHSL